MTLRVTEEDGLVLVHPGIGKEQRRVVVGHDARRGPVRVRVPLKIFHKSAPDLGLGPALGRVGGALSEAHRLRLGLKLGRHRRQRCACLDERAAVVVLMVPRLAWAQRIGLIGRNRLRRLSPASL